MSGVGEGGGEGKATIGLASTAQKSQASCFAEEVRTRIFEAGKMSYGLCWMHPKGDVDFARAFAG